MKRRADDDVSTLEAASGAAESAPASKRVMTKEEAQVYDRQLRVWGVDAQNRMLESKILLVGIGGLCTEICKNIVLAGVSKVTLADDQTAIARDLSSNYFLSESSIGSNRAAASRDSAAALNPMMHEGVDVYEGDVAKESAEFFKGYDVVFVSNRSVAHQVLINDLCRAAGTFFYSGDVCGLRGRVFCDLLAEYDYSIKRKVAKLGMDESSHGDKAQPIAIAEDEGGTRDKLKASFAPLGTALSRSWGQLGQSGRRKQQPLFLAFAVADAIRFGGASTVEEAVAQMVAAAKRPTEEAKGLAAAALSEHGELFKDIVASAGAEFCPTCAIVGGIAAQEMIKSITRIDHPFNDFFYFDANDAKTPGTLHALDNMIAPYKLPKPPSAAGASAAAAVECL